MPLELLLTGSAETIAAADPPLQAFDITTTIIADTAHGYCLYVPLPDYETACALLGLTDN